MTAAAHQNPPRMSVELFRAFCATRPDEEQWQLIDGVAVTMTRPAFGLSCALGDLYRGTALQPRR